MACRIVNLHQSLRNVVQSRKLLEINKQWRRQSSLAAVKERFAKRSPTTVSELSSGLKVATENTGVPTATVGVWIEAGPRFESDETNGVANLLEHLVFKGTTKRSQADLEAELESLGARVDAYTSREHTVFYAKCVKENIPKVVELLADILANPKLNEADIERERHVILRDVDEAPMNLKGVLFDYMHATAYQQTPLSRSVFGPTRNIKSLTKQNLVDYHSLFYKPARMTLIGAGGVNHDELVKLGEQFFNQAPSDMDHPLARAMKETPCRFTGSDLRHRDDYIPYCHAAYAVEGCPIGNPDYLVLALVNTLLGSWDRSQGIGAFNASPIARAAAQGKGIAYEAFNICYKDTALWGIYHISPRDKVEFMGADICDEMRRLCTSVNLNDVERGKNRLKMNLLLSEENATDLFKRIGFQLQCTGKRQPFHELEEQIDNISAGDVLRVLQDYWYDNCPVLVGIGPTEDLMDYEMLRSKMFWWMF